MSEKNHLTIWEISWFDGLGNFAQYILTPESMQKIIVFRVCKKKTMTAIEFHPSRQAKC